MSTNLNDRNALVISELAYVADKLGNLPETQQKKNLSELFFDSNGFIRDEIKADKDLNALAKNIQNDPNKYSDVLNNTKLVGTANDTATGYLGIALQNLQDKSVIIGNAGSGNKADLISDYQMTTGEIPNQLESGIAFIESLKKTEPGKDAIISDFSTSLNITGHSLGGSLSQLMVVSLYATNKIGVVKTFEAFGTADIVKNDTELTMLYNANSYIQG